MGCHEKFYYIRTRDVQKHYYGVVIRKLLYRLIDAAGKCDRCLGHKACLVCSIMRTDQWADYPVSVTATMLSCVYCRWDDVVNLAVL